MMTNSCVQDEMGTPWNLVEGGATAIFTWILEGSVPEALAVFAGAKLVTSAMKCAFEGKYMPLGTGEL
jgi:hypothetical protein